MPPPRHPRPRESSFCTRAAVTVLPQRLGSLASTAAPPPEFGARLAAWLFQAAVICGARALVISRRPEAMRLRARKALYRSLLYRHRASRSPTTCDPSTRTPGAAPTAGSSRLICRSSATSCNAQRAGTRLLVGAITIRATTGAYPESLPLCPACARRILPQSSTAASTRIPRGCTR